MSREHVAANHDGVPFVSIVVPTVNRHGTLADCVASLEAQDYPADRFEIVLIHGCRDANAARNLGVRRARGDLICFVDDDVVAPSGWLPALISGVSRNPDAGCLGGAIRPRFET